MPGRLWPAPSYGFHKTLTECAHEQEHHKATELTPRLHQRISITTFGPGFHPSHSMRRAAHSPSPPGSPVKRAGPRTKPPAPSPSTGASSISPPAPAIRSRPRATSTRSGTSTCSTRAATGTTCAAQRSALPSITDRPRVAQPSGPSTTTGTAARWPATRRLSARPRPPTCGPHPPSASRRSQLVSPSSATHTGSSPSRPGWCDCSGVGGLAPRHSQPPCWLHRRRVPPIRLHARAVLRRWP